MIAKPPPTVTIYIRDGYFWYYYYDSESKKPIRRTTGYPADIKESRKEGWWKKSQHAEALAQKIFKIQNPNLSVIHVPKRITLNNLLLEFNKYNEEKRDLELSSRTLEKRKLAIAFLLKYKPDFRLEDLSEELVKTFRLHGKSKLKPKSLLTYWIEYRAIFNFAVKKRWLSYNHFNDWSIHKPKTEPKQINKEEIEDALVFAYEHKIGLFGHLILELFNGIRVSESCNFRKEWVDSKHLILRYWNSKVREWELHPITSIMAWALDIIVPEWREWHLLSEKPSGYLLEFRNRKTLSYYFTRLCEFAGVNNNTNHDLKRLYTQLIAASNPDPRIFDMLVHHAPSVNVTAVEHYQGRDTELMKQVLEPVHEREWENLVNRINKAKRDAGNSPYKFSNPKSSEARKKKRVVQNLYAEPKQKIAA